MNYNQLLYFQKIANLGSISKAAEELFVSESALSKSLRSLELELGYDLFDRNGRRLALNEDGRNLLGMTDEIVKLMDDVKPRLRALHEGRQRFIIDTYYKFASEMLFEALSARYPSAQFISIETDKSPAEHIEDLVRRDVDIELISLSESEYMHLEPIFRENGIDSFYLFHEILFISAPPEEPYTSMKSLKPAELGNIKLSKVDDDIYSNIWFEKLVRLRGIDFSYHHIFDHGTFMNRWHQLKYPFITTTLYSEQRDYRDGFEGRLRIDIDDPEASRGVFMLYLDKDSARLGFFLDYFKDNFFKLYEYDEDAES